LFFEFNFCFSAWGMHFFILNKLIERFNLFHQILNNYVFSEKTMLINFIFFT